DALNKIGASWDYDDDFIAYYHMESSARNIYGLPILSVKHAYGTDSGVAANVLDAGGTIAMPDWEFGYLYPETEQPQLQTVEYDFWNSATDFLPGQDGFAVTN